MASIDLTVSQQSLLTTLVNLYRAGTSPVKGEAIATELDRAPGTVRNQMQTLKSLGIVESSFGPRGGYVPTPTAYEVLGIEQIDTPASVPVRCNDDKLEELSVETITLTNVDHPDRCRAEIRFIGSLEHIHGNDELGIGPTPQARLVIVGTVEGMNDTTNTVILDITELHIEARSD